MNTKLWFSLLLGTLLMTTTGCLEEPAIAPETKIVIDADPRAALIKALDKQVVNLVKGLNNVIIEGNFMKNISLNNPPKPIPIGDDNEVKKAIQYLLSQKQESGGYYIYKPDPRICTEVIAKESPANCIEVMKLVSLVQTPANDTEGNVEIRVGAARPFNFYYGENALIASAQVSEVVKALSEVDPILVVGTLPTIHEGALELKLSSAMTLSRLEFSISSPIDLQGQNENGHSYSIQISQAQNMFLVTLETLSSLGTVSVAIPTVAASLPVRDNMDVIHTVDFIFPGIRGTALLDNALESLALQSIKLNSTDFFASVDGQVAAHFHSASQIDAVLQSHANGDSAFHFSSEISAQIDVFQNALMNQQGALTAYIAPSSELFFKYQSNQAKVISGQFKIDITGSENLVLDAQPNMCVAGVANAGFPIQIVTCQ